MREFVLSNWSGFFLKQRLKMANYYKGEEVYSPFIEEKERELKTCLHQMR